MACYLITGGAGFVGSHLAKKLLELGHQIKILDIVPTLYSKALDITNTEDIDQALQSVDACFHLAAVVSVQQSINNPVHSHEVNFVGSLKLFEALAKRNIPVVYASSAAVYGDAQKFQPVSEEERISPLSLYAMDKYMCELYAKNLGHLKNLQSIGLRFFNVYGPGQKADSPYSGVIATFTDVLKKGQEIMVYGDGEQVRDFIHVSDIVNFLCKALEYTSTNAPVLNACTGFGTSINHLINILSKKYSKPYVKYLPKRKGDIIYSVGNNFKAFELFNMKAEISLTRGLELL